MKDRIPTPGQEGRMLITPENGDPPFYATVAMADNPSEDGTPLHKATLLKDATAALFGLDENAVPNDAFALLGKYNQHWWERIAVEQVIKYQISTQNSGYAYLRANLSEVKYAETVAIDEDTGEISLVNPVPPTSPSDLVNGKYIQNVRVRTANDITYIYDTMNIYFIPGYASGGGSDYVFFDGASLFQKVVPVAVEVNIGEASYVQSSDRNAYPDSGESDGFEWVYLGVPFENAATAPKIATGSYVGTGTKGSSGKNSITFSGVPKFLCVFSQNTVLIEHFVLWNGGTYAPSTIDNDGNYNKFTLNGNTLSWYAAGTNITAQTQCNDSGVTYTYFAILKEG